MTPEMGLGEQQRLEMALAKCRWATGRWTDERGGDVTRCRHCVIGLVAVVVAFLVAFLCVHCVHSDGIEWRIVVDIAVVRVVVVV